MSNTHLPQLRIHTIYRLYTPLCAILLLTLCYSLELQGFNILFHLALHCTGVLVPPICSETFTQFTPPLYPWPSYSSLPLLSSSFYSHIYTNIHISIHVRRRIEKAEYQVHTVGVLVRDKNGTIYQLTHNIDTTHKRKNTHNTSLIEPALIAQHQVKYIAIYYLRISPARWFHHPKATTLQRIIPSVSALCRSPRPSHMLWNLRPIHATIQPLTLI